MISDQKMSTHKVAFCYVIKNKWFVNSETKKPPKGGFDVTDTGWEQCVRLLN